MNRTEIFLSIVAVLAVTSAVVTWYREQNPPAGSKAQYVSVPEIKTVTKIKRVTVPVEKVVTIEKAAAVEKLQLPDEVAKDENKQVITTGEVAPYEGKTNVVAVLDTKTGESKLIAKQQPLPLFAFENKREVGFRYGFGSASKTNMEVDIYGRWDFLRVGNVHIGVYGEATTNGDGRAMISAGYSF